MLQYCQWVWNMNKSFHPTFSDVLENPKQVSTNPSPTILSAWRPFLWIGATGIHSDSYLRFPNASLSCLCPRGYGSSRNRCTWKYRMWNEVAWGLSIQETDDLRCVIYLIRGTRIVAWHVHYIKLATLTSMNNAKGDLRKRLSELLFMSPISLNQCVT